MQFTVLLIYLTPFISDRRNPGNLWDLGNTPLKKDPGQCLDMQARVLSTRTEVPVEQELPTKDKKVMMSILLVHSMSVSNRPSREHSRNSHSS